MTHVMFDATQSRATCDTGSVMVWRALGEPSSDRNCERAMAWGPHVWGARSLERSAFKKGDLAK
jgi:hypothetical protein